MRMVTKCRQNIIRPTKQMTFLHKYPKRSATNCINFVNGTTICWAIRNQNILKTRLSQWPLVESNPKIGQNINQGLP